VRYTFDFTLANTSGLTLGTANNNNLRVAIRMSDLSNGSFFQITGVQLEAGTVATPFRRNAPSIQAELAACQRYYERWSGGIGTPVCYLFAYSTTVVEGTLFFAPKRALPTISGSDEVYRVRGAGSTTRTGTISSFALGALRTGGAVISTRASLTGTFVTGYAYELALRLTDQFIEISAEL
jgi:hypothetical protein